MDDRSSRSLMVTRSSRTTSMGHGFHCRRKRDHAMTPLLLLLVMVVLMMVVMVVVASVGDLICLMA